MAEFFSSVFALHAQTRVLSAVVTQELRDTEDQVHQEELERQRRIAGHDGHTSGAGLDNVDEAGVGAQGGGARAAAESAPPQDRRRPSRDRAGSARRCAEPSLENRWRGARMCGEEGGDTRR